VHLEIGWCFDPGEAEKLARFFVSNVTSDYISHSELQGPRALARGTWAPNLLQILTDEIRLRVGETISKPNSGAPVAVVRTQACVVGIAFVSFFPDTNVPYVLIEDLVVVQAQRGHGIGAALLNWIFEQAIGAGCTRVFLESGVGNEGAHLFFEKQGFQTCSVVMMKDLTTE
jgi:GNAT superfamily N-acetyltransferase